MNMNALLITQYGRFGSVGINEYIENFIHEMSVTIDMLGDFNEFLMNNNESTIDNIDYLEEYISTLSPSDAFSLAYGNDEFSWSDDYFTINSLGNLQGFTETRVIKLMQENTDFLKWYIEEHELINEEEMQKDIADANELIKQGY